MKTTRVLSVPTTAGVVTLSRLVMTRKDLPAQYVVAGAPQHGVVGGGAIRLSAYDWYSVLCEVLAMEAEAGQPILCDPQEHQTAEELKACPVCGPAAIAAAAGA